MPAFDAAAALDYQPGMNKSRGRHPCGSFLLLWTALCLLSQGGSAGAEESLPKADGYRGIWYSNTATKDEYKFKYSGGFATYPQQHIPIAIYAKEVNKTFFVFGGTTDAENHKPQLLHMVSYFDHATGTVPRPTILLNK